jgi:drug/metabolite transporter (DMT)-like permease
MSVSPFLAALAGRLLLREAVPARTWAAMIAAFAGIIVMFAESLGTGRIAGNLLALGVPVCFALNLVVLRMFRARADMLPTVMLAGIWSLVPTFLLAGNLTASDRDLGILLLMGCVQLGAGCLLMTAASRALSATELGLLALLEPIFAPIWVWMLLGEAPAAMALIGGAIVLGAVLANELFAVWRGRIALAGPR